MSKLPTFEEAGFASVGFGFGVIRNFAGKRPIFASIHIHLIGTALGFMFGRYVHNATERRYREKRIYIEDYMRLHPEDFVEAPPKYYKDVLQKWYPVR
ncbi:NADH dehydrogenase [ubiquinone] 1 subunit C2-like [Liolophura sinensis]|uniref:NADH dehydrogenase [ubiquinone] 1 subunit C2-like n=1 Tax=Liolophura sinensis TaxID=3198878 RepID=UPI00315975E8